MQLGTTPGRALLGAAAIAIAAMTAAVSVEAQPGDARIAAAVAGVSEDELRRSMTTLVAFGTRFANVPRNATGDRHGVDAARDWIASQFSSFSPRLDVFYDVHSFYDIYPNRGERNLYNVVAELPGTRFPERRILVVAHYDSMTGESWIKPRAPAPGASDNATGTACILEVARILSGHEFDKTIVFIAFSGEEHGLLGSAAYVATLPPTERGIEAVLNNDIVGNELADDGTRVADRIRIFATREADSPARALAHRIVDATARHVPGFAADVIAANDRSGRSSDHMSFLRGKYAAVRLVAAVEMLRNQHNHRDTLEHVSIPYLAQATRVNVAAGGDVGYRRSGLNRAVGVAGLPGRLRRILDAGARKTADRAGLVAVCGPILPALDSWMDGIPVKLLLDGRGVPVSTSDRDSLSRFEAALASLHASRGDTLKRIEDALACDPDFVLGHCLRAATFILASEAPAEPGLAQSVDALERLANRANDRERRHAAAARAWLDGDARLALERYGELVIDYPRDTLALFVAHALDFRLGQREMLRDRIAEVLPSWDAGVPQFGYVLGMYAFGLEETGDYGRAQAAARRSLELEPDNAAAMHVIAHVLEMQGRAQQGIVWLESTRQTWGANSGYAVHNAWHLALFHLDLDATDAAIAIYDQLLAPRSNGATAALVDASALLWRLMLRGMDLRARWRVLAQGWRRKPLRGQRAFNLVHAVIAFTAAGELQLARRVIDLLRTDDATRSANTASDLELAVPLCQALEAFSRGQYAHAIEQLNAVRAIAHRCGGSVAQCDLIHLTFVEAALRSHRARLARALAAERTARKPDSPLNRWLFARAGAMVRHDTLEHVVSEQRASL